MSRDSKLEVGALNLRIPDNKDRNYAALIAELAKLKRGFRVYGDTALAIQSFNEKSGRGIISKFTEIDLKGEWFDVDTFTVAGEKDKNEINIPAKLRPNYAAFYFQLNSKLHVVAFETYSESKSLSVASVEKYFRSALLTPQIESRFGRVEADVIKSFDETARLMSLKNIKEIRFFIRRPNPDDIGEDLAKAIEEQLGGQNADEYRETLKTASPKGGITPNERSKMLARIAAENGQVEVVNIENGIPVPHGSRPTPLIEGVKYQPDQISTMQELFSSICTKIFNIIIRNRKENA